MLSRVADSIFWMSRYVERAENVARVVDVTLQLMLDLPISSVTNQWEAVVVTTADQPLFQNLYGSLKPGGWLVAQCGGGPNLSRLLERMAVLLQRPRFAPYLADYKHSWVYSDAETAAQRLRSAGFVEVDTSLEQAPTRLEDDQRYREFVSKVIVHRHLERIPDSKLQREFMAELSRQAAKDDPPFELDYWRLNLNGRRPA